MDWVIRVLKPTSDRLDYGRLLSPPFGYETVFAVGTTYSLDLDALIGISIALGLSESIDNELKDNPIYLLEAIQKTADKVLIFCEGGQIKAPFNSNSLHILLEKMVVEVKLRNKRSFHPKFWLVKYQNRDGDSFFRCVVLSRNLTFDRSWDVAACLEGEVLKDLESEVKIDRSVPLSDFVKALIKHAKRSSVENSKIRLLNYLANELLKVDFQINDKRFEGFNFFPIGIPGYDIEKTGLFNSYHEMFMITPFLSRSTVGEINKLALKSNQNNTLITLRSEAHKLKPEDISRFDIYAMKDIIIDGEDAISEGNENSLDSEKQKQDIHAKVYLRTKYAFSELLLGSLNASQNACYGNVEFLLRLYGKRKNLNVEMFKKDIFGEDDKDNPFEKIIVSKQSETDKSAGDDLEKIIKAISRTKSGAQVISNDRKYDVEIRFEKLTSMENVFISPLLSNKKLMISDTIKFEELNMLQLSEFYMITVEGDNESIKRLIKIKTDNMPTERESQIVNSVIKDKRGFIQYLSFILGEDYLLSLFEIKKNEVNSILFGSGEPLPAIYEKMLRSAYHSPHKFKEIKRLLEMITDENIIPEGFTELFSTFEKVVD